MKAGPVASLWRITAGSVVDLTLIVTLALLLFPMLSNTWEQISGAPVEAPIIGFMSSYSKPAQNGYWLLVLQSLCIAALLLPLCTIALGASPGKALFGIRYTDTQGKPASLGRVLLKTGFNLTLILSIVLPGPILGFVFGPSVDWLSFTLLVIALGFAVWSAVWRSGKGVPAVYEWAGIEPRLRRDRGSEAP